jgi:hypothetical protein
MRDGHAEYEFEKSNRRELESNPLPKPCHNEPCNYQQFTGEELLLVADPRVFNPWNTIFAENFHRSDEMTVANCCCVKWVALMQRDRGYGYLIRSAKGP